VAFADGQTLDIPMELSAAGLARKGELEAQAIAREQSEADAQATTVGGAHRPAGQQSYIRLEGMPNESLTIGDTGGPDANLINVIQQGQEKRSMRMKGMDMWRWRRLAAALAAGCAAPNTSGITVGAETDGTATCRRCCRSTTPSWPAS
jgi:hypothetical protein